MQPKYPTIHVYCDESCTNLRYMVIGSLWVPGSQAELLVRSIGHLKDDACDQHEIKWHHLTKKTLPLYQKVVDCAMSLWDRRYRAIVVDQHILNHALFNDGDSELGFYKFYYQLLLQEIRCRYQYLKRKERYVIFPDERSDRQAQRVRDLQAHLNRRLRFDLGLSYNPVSSIDPRSSRECPALQVADVLTGAIGAARNGNVTAIPKLELIRYVESKLGRSPDTLARPSLGGRQAWFNVWLWKPSVGSRRLVHLGET